MAGAMVGLCVGLAFDVAAGVFWLLSTPRLTDPGLTFVIGVATPVAGLTAGRSLGRAAFAAHGRLSWAGIVVGVTFVATVTGALMVALALAIGGAIANTTDPVSALATALMMTLAGAAIGVLLIGPFVAPFTGTAALIWASVMAWLSRRRRSVGP